MARAPSRKKVSVSVSQEKRFLTFLTPFSLTPFSPQCATGYTFVRLLGTGARFWLNQQTRYAIAIAERDHGARIAPEVDRTGDRRPEKESRPRFSLTPWALASVSVRPAQATSGSV
jgi:hypothetical protein